MFPLFDDNPTEIFPFATIIIMGAYLLLYPRARVHTLFFFVIFFKVFRLPAWFFLIYWLTIQLVSSALRPQGGGGGGKDSWSGPYLTGFPSVLPPFRS
jgi:hypothetical protein